jgi:hypothetical protein
MRILVLTLDGNAMETLFISYPTSADSTQGT